MLSGCVTERVGNSLHMRWCEDWISSPLLSTQRALDRCSTVRTQGQVSGGDTQNVLWLQFAWEVDLFYDVLLKQQCRRQGTSVSARMYVLCVCESNWLIMSQRELFIAPHLKMITCCRCRWQQQWCTPRFCFDVRGQGRAAGLTTPTEVTTHIRNACKYMQHFPFSVKCTSVQRFYANNTKCVMS